jgi:hypothetical protein
MKTAIKLSLYLSAIALSVIPTRPAMSDQITTTKTTDESTMSITTNEFAPCVVMTGSTLQPEVVVTKLSLHPTPVVTRSGQITEFVVFKPDDLIARRNDLLARIAVERSRGKLSADESANLISRVQSIDSNRLTLTGAPTVSYFKQVKRIYRDYDRLSDDINSNAHESEQHLAGRYNYLTL